MCVCVYVRVCVCKHECERDRHTQRQSNMHDDGMMMMAAPMTSMTVVVHGIYKKTKQGSCRCR